MSDAFMVNNAAEADDGGEWREQRRKVPCDRNSLWRLWLRGCPATDSRVERLLQDYGQSLDDWPVDPWKVKAADRLQLARRCAFCVSKYFSDIHHTMLSLVGIEVACNPWRCCRVYMPATIKMSSPCADGFTLSNRQWSKMSMAYGKRCLAAYRSARSSLMWFKSGTFPHLKSWLVAQHLVLLSTGMTILQLP